MISAHLRVLLGLAGAGVGAAALLIGAGAWTLARGPIPLAPLVPRIERALAAEWPDYQISIGDLAISAGAGFAVGIRAFDVRAARADGAAALRVPEMAVSLSALALARGEVAPRRIALAAPVASLRVGGASAAGELRTALAESSGGSGFAARLRALDVTHATVVLDGAGGERVFTLPRVALRRESGVLTANARLSTELEGETLAIDVAARRDANDGSARVAASFVDLNPARLAGLAPELAPAARFDAPLSGEVAFARGADGGAGALAFDVTAGAGEFEAPPPYAPGTRFAMIGARAAGRLEDGFRRVAFDALEIDFGGPALALEGAFGGDWTKPDVTLDLVARAAPVDELGAYWPPAAAPNARVWVMERMSGGTLDEFALRVSVAGDEWELPYLPADRVTGRVAITGASVRYLDDLPAVDGIAAAGEFDAELFTLDVAGGRSGPLEIHGGAVEIRDAPDGAGYARIEAAFSGGVGETLAVLDRPPLRLVSPLGLDPARMSGAMRGELTVRLPLAEDAGMEAVAVSVAAQIEEAAMELSGDRLRRVHDGSGTLTVDKDGFELAGEAALDGVPGTLLWREGFGPDKRRRVAVSTVLDAAARDRFGLGFDWLSGPVAAELEASASGGGPMAAAVSVDAAAAAAALPALQWEKPPGAPASASATLVLDDDGSVGKVARFEIAADGLAAAGSAAPVGGGGWTARLERLRLGRTDVSGVVRTGGGAATALLDGARLDLRAAFRSGGADPPPPFVLSAKVSELVVDDSLSLADATVLVSHDGRVLERAAVDGLLPGGAPIALRVREGADGGPRALTVSTEDAGQAFDALGLTPNMVGGTLNLDGEIGVDGDPEAVRGELLVSGFRMVDAPVLARLLSLISVTGALETLGGEGLSFDSFRAPYDYRGGVLTLDGAVASGVSLGVTMDGAVDFGRNTVDISGNVVPFYGLNAVVGAVPLVGDLLTGGDKEGVFAAPYSVSGDREDPAISVNPLAMALPGVLRNFMPGAASPGG